MKRERLIRWTIVVLLVAMGALVSYKVLVLGYTFDTLIPQPSYSVKLTMTFAGNGEDVVVRTFLPQNEQNQVITDEIVSAPGLGFRRDTTSLYSRGEWRQYDAEGPYTITHSYGAQIRPVTYNIDPDLRIPGTYPEGFEQYLEGTAVVQIDDPTIVDLTRKLVDAECCLLATLESLYDHVYAMGSRPFKGTTDAVTAAKLGEASCNGKSRLFIAMARRLGIPARLVGGLILNSGSKRTSHQWLEVYVAGHWIPIDTLNGHFAALPSNYLALYRGDEALFVHSRNIAFDYRFNITKRIVTNNRLAGFLGGHAINLYSILTAFRRVNISLNLLKFLLVIPLGVLVVVVSRNVVGINTFGTFLPALMAMAIRETGLAAGIVAFVFVLAVTVVVRMPLEKLGILHTPKLAVMMVVVIISLLGLTVLSDLARWEAFSTIGAASLFPIAILTITAERFAITMSEEGAQPTLLTMAQTLVVMSACFVVMSSVALQALMLAFPELLLAVIALNIGIGSWTGLRITEMVRFRALYTAGGTDGT